MRPGPWIVLLALVVTLTGCGFHLRGTGGGAFGIDAIAVVAGNPYAELEGEVSRALTEAGATLQSAGDAPFVLDILSERLLRRPIGTSGQISVAELELQLVVLFQVEDRGGDLVLPETTLSVERIYSFDNTRLVGNSAEEEVLTREMRRDLASQMLRRVDAALKANGTTR